MEKLVKHNWFIWNMAHIISFTRLILALLVVFFLPLDAITKLLICIILFSTDALDGYIARKTGNKGKIGKLIDGSADKVVVISTFFLMIKEKLIEGIVALIVIGGEVFVIFLVLSGIYVVIEKEAGNGKLESLLRKYSEVRKAVINDMETSIYGKMKMTAYFLAITFVFLNAAFGPSEFLTLSCWLMFALGIIFSVVAGKNYYDDFQEWLLVKKNPKK